MSPDINQDNNLLNPMALRVEDAARILGLSAEVLHKHIDQGAPLTGDGTVNLVHYAAWLNQQLSKVNP